MPRNVIDDLPPIKTGPLIMYMTRWVVAGPPFRPGREGGIKCQRRQMIVGWTIIKKKLIIPGIMYITLTLY